MPTVRRTRFVDPYKVPNDNPYREPGKGPDFFWRQEKEIDVFKKAELRQLSHDGNEPGMKFQLRVPMTDPETGSKTDADGDRALLRIEMVGATLDIHSGYPTVKGFVSRVELAHEEAYRAGDLDGCLASYDGAPRHEYVLEEWQVMI